MIWAAAAGAVLATAFFALAELAIVSAERLRLRQWVRGRTGGAHWSGGEPLDGPFRLLAPILAGQVLTVTAAATLVARGLSGDDPADAAAALRVAAWTALVLVPPLYVLGETLPRAVARARAHQMLPFVAAVLTVAGWLFRPLTAASHAISAAVLRRTARDVAQGRGGATRRRLEALLAESERVGVVEPAEREIIAGVFEFGRTPVGAVMTPVERMVGAPAGARVGEITALIQRTGYSRIPIWSAGAERVVGMVHVFDLFRSEPDRQPVPRAVVRVPPDAPCDQVLLEMKRRRRHLAVIEAAGSVAGMVTMEDLVEELVGEIRDEHDVRAEALAGEADTGLVVDGRARLADILETLGVEGLDGGPGTVADLLTERLGRSPRSGETIVIDGWSIEVLDATLERVRRVRVRPAGPTADSAPTD